MKFHLGVALVAFSGFMANESYFATAHQAVGDEDDQDSYLLNRQGAPELETIGKFEKTTSKHEIVHAFQGQSRKQRGHLIISRNKNTNQIVDLELVELSGADGYSDEVF